MPEITDTQRLDWLLSKLRCDEVSGTVAVYQIEWTGAPVFPRPPLDRSAIDAAIATQPAEEPDA